MILQVRGPKWHLKKSSRAAGVFNSLFYCRWFDPTPNGLRRTEDLGLVEVKHALRLSNFDPFVMASQVTQVYYLSYPCKNRDLSPWWVVY